MQKKFSRAPTGVGEKWILKIKNASMLCENLQVLNCIKNFVKGFRRGRQKMGFRNQNCTYSVRKNTSLELQKNFGKGFRRGRQKMGFRNQNCTCSVRKKYKSWIGEHFFARAFAGVDEKWVLEIKIAPVLCEKIQVLYWRKIFGKGFRKGGRKMGFKK